MPSGILGQAAPAANTNTTVYTVPAGLTASLTLSILNRNSSVPSSLRVALASSSTPQNSEYIEYGTNIPASGVLERTGLLLQAGKQIVVYASTADVSVSVYGYEE